MTFDYSHPEIREAVRRALEEDIGPGDITTDLCVPAERRAKGQFIARGRYVIAGTPLLPMIYEMRGGVEDLRVITADGDETSDGMVVARVTGPARTLLTCERVALNFLQRLSGVATLARRYVEAVRGTRCTVLDTRKTTPGLRRLEKLAAAAGGVTNHRVGLFDAILIKNNHIAAAGGVRPAIEHARGSGLPVEIEVRTREELREALEAGVERVLLDNFTPEQAAEEIRWINGRTEVEISGGITPDNIRAYAEAGPDFISCGAITHSATAADINFRLDLL
jgi:nicotinate-nucleotide pyrophosphorylase (carboxylating)